MTVGVGGGTGLGWFVPLFVACAAFSTLQLLVALGRVKPRYPLYRTRSFAPAIAGAVLTTFFLWGILTLL